METIGYRGQSFFTDSGRQILFNGLNVLCEIRRWDIVIRDLQTRSPGSGRVDLT